MARRRLQQQMSPRRIVPTADAYEGVVEFKDGRRIVPDWQQPFLDRGQSYVDMTYAEWVEREVRGRETAAIFRRARTEMIRQHMGL